MSMVDQTKALSELWKKIDESTKMVFEQMA